MKNIPRITSILRGYTFEQVNTVAEVILENELQKSIALEITSNSPNSFESIAKLANRYGDRLLIGAGTILNMKQAQQAVNAGAEFILSPISLSKEILDYCSKNNVVTVPAAFTPTEIYRSFQNGANVVKIFPVSSLNNTFLKDVQAPLGELNLMAVGGINKDNAKDFLNEVKYIGVGSAMFNKEDVIKQDKNKLKKSLLEFIDVL